jgi:hypothetical protein
MSATIAASGAARTSRARPLRVILIALAIAALLVVSFLVGRATAGTTAHAPAIRPAAATHPSSDRCQVGRPC